MEVLGSKRDSGIPLPDTAMVQLNQKSFNEGNIRRYSSSVNGSDVIDSLTGNTPDKKVVSGAYKKNAIVYRCANLISDAAAQIPFKVFLNDEEVERDDPLFRILKRPNKMQGHVEWAKELYTYLLITGNSFIHKVENSERTRDENGNRITSKIPRELMIVRPDAVSVVVDKATGRPEKYTFKTSEGDEEFPVDPRTCMSAIKHFKMFNPLGGNGRGLSPLSAAWLDIVNHNTMLENNIRLTSLGGRPAGMFQFRNLNDEGKEVGTDPEKMKEIKDDFEKSYNTNLNSGKMMLTFGNYDYKNFGLTQQEMEFIEGRNLSAKDIALVMGVPSPLIITENNSYNNYQTALLSLIQDTVIPLARRVESDLNEWLAVSFGPGYRIEYDFDAIPAMQRNLQDISKHYVEMVKNAMMTPNEARERMKLEDMGPIGDQLMISGGMYTLKEIVERVGEPPNDENEPQD